LLRIRAAAIRDEVTTAAPTEAAIVKLPSDLVVPKLVVPGDSPEIKILEALIVDQNILAPFIALSRSTRPARGSHIGDRRRSDIMHRFTGRGAVTIRTKNSDLIGFIGNLVPSAD
jgi:hypothetical protein